MKNQAKNYEYNFENVRDREALLRPLSVTYDPGGPHQRQGPSRFTSILDGVTGAELAAVSDQYTLVQNSTTVAAVEQAADVLGVNIQPKRAKYRNGVSRLSWGLPDEEFNPGNTNSGIEPQFEVSNDYRAGGSLKMEGGLWILVCENGMRRADWTYTKTLVHRGVLTQEVLYLHYVELMDNVLKRLDGERQVIRLLANTQVNDAWVDRVLKSVRSNREPVMARLITENQSRHGANAWALAQAVTEAATHEFPDTWANDTWSAKQVDALIKDVKRVTA